mgnify:CR=1 FL=1
MESGIRSVCGAADALANPFLAVARSADALANPGGGNEAEMALDITAVSLVPTVLPLRIVAVHLGI